jgi:hypothetical protein
LTALGSFHVNKNKYFLGVQILVSRGKGGKNNNKGFASTT